MQPEPGWRPFATPALRLPALLLAAGCATPKQSASPASPATTRDAPVSEARAAETIDLPIETYRLDNGMKVILHPDHRLPLVALSIWYDVGALHERPGRSGFAHLFEHMMFQGSPHVGEDRHFATLEEIGASGVNGTTSFDRTNYYETVPSNTLEIALWLESDRMGFLLESVTQESLDNQIDVVRNERRQSIESAPYGLMNEAVTKALFPPPHPYHGNVIGSLEDIGAATLDDVRDFFLTYYSPANATLVLAGDIDIAKTKALVDRYFGPLEGRPKPPRPEIEPPRLSESRTIPFTEPVARLPKLTVVWPGPTAFAKDNAALDLLAHVLSGNRSSRLDVRVTHDASIAQQVSAGFREYFAGGRFQIDVVLQPGHTHEEALAAIDEVLATIETSPPSPEELARAKNSVETRMTFGLQKLGARAERLQTYNHYLGEPDRLAWDLERYRGVEVDDLVRVYRRWLKKPRLVIQGTPASGGQP